jgi:hypothetical protein
VTQGSNYFAQVIALNGAGLNSTYNPAADITPPRILFTKPDGEVIRQPILVVSTDEIARCYYRTIGDEYSLFDYTDTTLHQSVYEAANGPTNLEIMCEDTAGLKTLATISFTYQEASAATLSVNFPVDFYVGQDVPINLSLSQGAQGLGELRKEDLSLSLDSTALGSEHYSLWDSSGGTYNLVIDGSFFPEARDYDVVLEASPPGFSTTLPFTITINPLVFDVSYSQLGTSPVNLDRISYISASNSAQGIASDSSEVYFQSGANNINISSGLDGRTMVFLTRSARFIDERDDSLEEYKIPLTYGYSKSSDIYTNMALIYEDHAFNDLSLFEGNPTVVIRNMGMDGDRVVLSVEKK